MLVLKWEEHQKIYRTYTVPFIKEKRKKVSWEKLWLLTTSLGSIHKDPWLDWAVWASFPPSFPDHSCNESLAHLFCMESNFTKVEPCLLLQTLGKMPMLLEYQPQNLGDFSQKQTTRL